MNIFKKIWYSIGNTKKYEEMVEQGLLKALQYITILIILFSFIMSGLIIYKMDENYKEQQSYIQENIPELSYKEGVLKFETQNEIILSDEIVKKTIGGKVIINTNDYSEELKNTYTEQITNEGGYGAILFSKSIILIITENGQVQTNEYEYTELFKQYLGEDVEFDKQGVITYLDNIPYMQYFIMYTVTYFLAMFIIMAVNIVVMSLIGLLYVKLTKIDVKYKTILSISIYANTIGILLNTIYYTIQAIFGIAIPYFDVIYISIPYIYLIKTLIEKNK